MVERSKLSALLTGLMSAVQKASTTSGQQNLYLLDHYFDKVNGAYVPKKVKIEVSPGTHLDVPLITLIEPGGYKLDCLEMELSIKLQLQEIKKATHECLEQAIKKGSYQVELCPKSGGDRRQSDVVDIKISFKGDDPSEGLMKIVEELNNTITSHREVPVDPLDSTAETEVEDVLELENLPPSDEE